jgi:hypothetical protein
MPRRKRVDKVEHGHPKVVYDRPRGGEGESDTPMNMQPTKREGRSVNRANIIRTNRKRKK